MTDFTKKVKGKSKKNAKKAGKCWKKRDFRAIQGVASTTRTVGSGTIGATPFSVRIAISGGQFSRSGTLLVPVPVVTKMVFFPSVMSPEA